MLGCQSHGLAHLRRRSTRGGGLSTHDERAFLAWALPRLGLRWAGFDGVHGQVVKRVSRRARALGLAGFDAYRARLEADAAEWKILDGFCRVTISRFYRERAVFELLRTRVLPDLAIRARARGASEVRALCLGAAGGEEPYSLRIAWERMEPQAVALSVVAIEADEAQLARGRAAVYRASTLSELPAAFVAASFEREGETYRLRERVREGVTFCHGDVRDAWPLGPFDLVLCRNLVFTYFDEALQAATLARIVAHLGPDGVLVIGRQDRLPPCEDLVELAAGTHVFRRALPRDPRAERT